MKCTEVRRDGTPCKAWARADDPRGRCYAHRDTDFGLELWYEQLCERLISKKDGRDSPAKEGDPERATLRFDFDAFSALVSEMDAAAVDFGPVSNSLAGLLVDPAERSDHTHAQRDQAGA
jgi:hypothetical protein